MEMIFIQDLGKAVDELFARARNLKIKIFLSDTEGYKKLKD